MSGPLRDSLLAEQTAIDGLLVEMVEAPAPVDAALQNARWIRFVGALVAQLDAEDELVAALPHERDVRVLILEHRYIRGRLAELGEAARRGELATSALKSFRDVLRAHTRNDDRLLYGWVDGGLAAERRKAVFEGLTTRIERMRSSAV